MMLNNFKTTVATPWKCPGLEAPHQHGRQLLRQQRLAIDVDAGGKVVRLGLMLQMKPDYVEMLWKDELGIKMSVFALVMQVLGSLWIKKIIDIKV